MRRRDFLSKATAAGGAALLGSCLPPVIKTSSASPFGLFPTINVRNHGAVGNGIADDAAAIKAAQAALTNGATLYFPAGEYRFATPNPAGRAAITLAGLSFVTVKFDPGAKLVMDNLVGGKGTSHGIRIVGPAAYVNLVNPTIEWKTAPTYRSTGDGINVLGYPSFFPPKRGWVGSRGAVLNLTITNGRVVNAPQTGAVIMGASEVAVHGFAATRTLADGLHFNASSGISVNNYQASNTGDDGLAFVTYYHASNVWQIPDDGPFNQPTLGGWNNSGWARNVNVSNGAANGVRVQGSKDVSLSNVQFTDLPGSGVIVDSATIGNNFEYSGLAPRGVTIRDMIAVRCSNGFEIQAGNIIVSSPAAFYKFGVNISGVTLQNCPNSMVFTGGVGVERQIRAGISARNVTVVPA